MGERNSSSTHLLKESGRWTKHDFLRGSVMDSSFSHLCTYVKLEKIVKCKKKNLPTLKKLLNLSSLDSSDLYS